MLSLSKALSAVRMAVISSCSCLVEFLRHHFTGELDISVFYQSKQQTSAPQKQQQQQTELHPQWNPTSQLCIVLIAPRCEFPPI